LEYDQRLTVEVVYSGVDGLLGELGYRPVPFLIASNMHISELLLAEPHGPKKVERRAAGRLLHA
jgi:hypothetical protein